MPKTKIDATKVLLDAGWSLDEIKAVLEGISVAWYLPGEPPELPKRIIIITRWGDSTAVDYP